MNIIANTDTSFFSILFGIVAITLGIILILLTILMPCYVYAIYRQGVAAKKANELRDRTLTRMLFAMESINVKMGGE